MTVVGFNFTKIHAERKQASENNVRVENNVGITNVSESNIIDPNKSLLKFEFNFICKYEPGMGVIELTGELLEIFDKKLGVKILEEWTKEKKVNKEFMTSILNSILSKANIQAICTSKDIGLPPPIAMPRVEIKQGAKPAEQTAAVSVSAQKTDKPAEKNDKQADKKKK